MAEHVELASDAYLKSYHGADQHYSNDLSIYGASFIASIALITRLRFKPNVRQVLRPLLLTSE
jgi:hypothetical protein